MSLATHTNAVAGRWGRSTSVPVLGSAIVVLQHPTETLTATNVPTTVHGVLRFEEFVVDALVIPLRMIVGYVLSDGSTQRSLTE